MEKDWRAVVEEAKAKAATSGKRGALSIIRRIAGGPKKLIFGAILLIVFIFVYTSSSTYVPPNMVGVRQVYFGSNAGLQKDTFGPGLYMVISGVERLHLFPTDLQIVNFSDSQSETSKSFRTAPAVKIQTSDGYNVVLDVSVLYRISDAHRIIVDSGPGRAFEDRLVVPRSDRILRKTLGELNSEQFYQGPQRIEKARNAEEMLRAELAPFGIALDAVLVRRFTYDERYQSLIEGRKIKDQTVFLRQAEAAVAIEERKRDTIIAEGKANQEVELARGASEIKKLQSQADLIRRKKAAEGQLLIELAEAKGTQLENDALQGAGSENMVGLKMAEVLQGIDGLVLNSSGKDGLNPLDLAGLLQKFEVK